MVQRLCNLSPKKTIATVFQFVCKQKSYYNELKNKNFCLSFLTASQPLLITSKMGLSIHMKQLLKHVSMELKSLTSFYQMEKSMKVNKQQFKTFMESIASWFQILTNCQMSCFRYLKSCCIRVYNLLEQSRITVIARFLFPKSFVLECSFIPLHMMKYQGF